MSMIFELHTVAVDDENNCSKYFSILKIVLSTTFCPCKFRQSDSDVTVAKIM